MKRTRPAILVVLAVAGGAIGWLLEMALATAGRAVVLPPATLAAALFGIGAIVLVFGWPIRQAVRGVAAKMIDPFRATRVLLLAKASSLAGALLGGAGIGLLVFLLSRPVVPPAASLLLTALSAVGAVFVLVSGLIVEHWCRIPPTDDPENDRSLGLQGD